MLCYMVLEGQMVSGKQALPDVVCLARGMVVCQKET